MARTDSEYEAKEAKQRFEAALRGARIAGPQHKVEKKRAPAKANARSTSLKKKVSR